MRQYWITNNNRHKRHGSSHHHTTRNWKQHYMHPPIALSLYYPPRRICSITKHASTTWILLQHGCFHHWHPLSPPYYHHLLHHHHHLHDTRRSCPMNHRLCPLIALHLWYHQLPHHHLILMIREQRRGSDSHRLPLCIHSPPQSVMKMCTRVGIKSKITTPLNVRIETLWRISIKHWKNIVRRKICPNYPETFCNKRCLTFYNRSRMMLHQHPHYYPFRYWDWNNFYTDQSTCTNGDKKRYITIWWYWKCMTSNVVQRYNTHHRTATIHNRYYDACRNDFPCTMWNVPYNGPPRQWWWPPRRWHNQHYLPPRYHRQPPIWTRPPLRHDTNHKRTEIAFIPPNFVNDIFLEPSDVCFMFPSHHRRTTWKNYAYKLYLVVFETLACFRKQSSIY